MTATLSRDEYDAKMADLNAKEARIGADMTEISARAGARDLTAGEQEKWDRLAAGQAKVRSEMADLMEARRDEVRALAGKPGHTESGDGARGAENLRTPSQRDGALRLLDGLIQRKQLPEHAAEKVENLLRHAESENERSLTARWVATAGDPNYATAFAKLMSDPQRGHMLWDGPEAEAYRSVAKVQAEMRAMSVGTDSAGGYMVPLTLDPAILLTSDGSINPLRRISRVVQTVTNEWQGVSSAGVTAEWKAEAAEVADASPTLGDEPIPVHFGDAFVPYSFEVGMDAVRFLEELRGLLLDGANQLMATAYTTGTGTGQPTGIVTALAGTSSEINGGGTEALAAADAYTLQNALPPRFQARAQWCANLAVINTFAQFETTNGALKFPEIRNGQLLRKPLNELSNMDGALNAAATANNYMLLYGDFSNFVIVDRIGTTLEFVPMLMGANRRPTGQRGALLWFRTGSNVVVPQAFRMLDVPTTA